MPNPPDAIGLALRIIDDVRDETERELLQPGKKPLRLPTLEAAMDSAKLGSALLARIDALERKHLPEEIQLTLALARDHAHIWSVRADWYWTAFDPLSGMFNMYGPTAYCLGYCVASMAGELARAPLADAGDRFRYLAGIADLAAHVDAMTERTRGQAERGIFLPRLQAKAAIELLDRLIARQPAELQVDEARLQGQDAFRSEVDRNVADHLVVALTRCRNLFDTAYLGRAGDDVGMMHLPDGADIYAELAKMHTSTKLSPLDLHRIGLDAIAAIRAQMEEARRDASFSGSDAEYRAHLDADPRWRDDKDPAIQARFETYVDRFRPYVEELFPVRPEATYGVRPLPEALTASMTFGYYDGPKPGRRHGDYVFNGHNLAKAGLFHVAALNYHELVPGHHLHLALQGDNLALPALRKAAYPTAFTEGWAEYAATLAGEIGMYSDPAERFGRLVSQAFLACRMVVDTGMNALGWSLEQARFYMRENSFFPESEIASETLRYACDIPGQALAYMSGHQEMLRLRQRMADARGHGFHVSQFHDLVLSGGAMAFPLLAERIDNAVRVADHA
ncbi:MAG: DUF885 domain-containing protein [Novosphingobium sp.]|jgi:uncharacterized protein (DUF885 family)|uniref:DUF885 domain-containing protein n=1 Tax=Novosphingobium sp. TaxID=1874826 RepID=UPI003918AF53